MSRAAARRSKRRRNERACGIGGRIFCAPDRRHGAALLVSAALVLAADAGADLLAGSAAIHVGFPAALYFKQRGILCPRGCHLHWRCAAVGYSVSRPAR